MSENRSRSTWIGLGLALFLFALNAWICHRLFAVEFIGNLQTNEGAFMSIARFFRDHWNDYRWFPWFDGGMPIENAYQPLLPVITAVISAVSGWSIARSFHCVLAVAYCLGPVTLFWFAWDWSRSLSLSFLAGLCFSLVSPAALLIPALRVAPAGISMPLRLYNLVYYGEGPHIVALALFPVALLLLRRAMERPGRWSIAGAILACAAVVLTNAFGAVGLALGVLCILVVLRRGLLVALMVGVSAWMLASPWLPPALIATITRNSWTERGFYQGGISASAALVALAVAFVLLALVTRRMESPFERFSLLLALWMCAFPIAYVSAGITLVPQGNRYQIEMELALALVLACLLVRVIAHRGMLVRGVLAAVLLVLLLHQARTYRNFAHNLIRVIDIQQTVEYKVADWIGRNLPGQRTMVSGDAAWLFNVFEDGPQFSAGHEILAPNFIQQIAVFQLYSGLNAGDRDAEISLFWLKAFGNQAVTVPGADTRESYQPYTHPRKFDGLLPVLWRQDGDTIYRVPQRSASLAHVIPKEAVVVRRPVHGLDLGPAQAYVAALDDALLPGAELTWLKLSRATFHTTMSRGQLLSVQVTYDPAWRAHVGGRDVPIRKDGLGLMILDPACDGPCDVELFYGATAETWFCRVMSALVAAGLVTALGLRSRRNSPGSR